MPRSNRLGLTHEYAERVHNKPLLCPSQRSPGKDVAQNGAAMKMPFKVGESVKKLNPGLFVEGPHVGVKKFAQAKRSSKLEDRYWCELMVGMVETLKRGGQVVEVQRQFRVRVTEWDAIVPVHYTADFAVWRREGTAWVCDLIEVKDSRRKPHSDELVRPKLARMRNPWINSVTLATWDGKAWEHRELAGDPKTLCEVFKHDEHDT